MDRHWEWDPDLYPVAEFIDPWLGDKVNSGLGLSYRNARLYMAGGPVRQPYAGVDFIPQSRIFEFGYWWKMAHKKVKNV